MLTQEQREKLIAEGRTWVGTPYRGHSCVKGGGADCGQLLYGIYRAVGLIPRFELPKDYSLQVAQHRASTEYVDTVLQYFREIPEEEALPGDLVIYQLGLAFAHGGMIMEWPNYVLQADLRNGVSGTHGLLNPHFKDAERRFFTRKDGDQC